jgi:hypothetical protein
MFDTKYNKDYSNFHKFIHIFLGGLLALETFPYKKLLFISILIYQFGQLLLNVRFFIDKLEIKEGNSIEHTINKLKDYAFGYVLMSLLGKK